MNQRILITGSCGLVGTAIAPILQQKGTKVELFDLLAHGDAQGDVRDLAQVRSAIEHCDGIIHLAAISRVIWGEQDPEGCWATNVGGLQNVLNVAASSQRQPWVVFASSREVYGQPEELPVDEDCPLQPVNIYGRSKIKGESLIENARRDGVRASTIRLSNVFGSIDDHVDRVVPAFARGAAFGHELRVDGANHTFDFTHIDDVATGIVTLAALMSDGGPPPPPIHFVSGVPTTLEQLAHKAIKLADSKSTVRYAPPRNFDVARFFGSPARAKALLGWTPRVALDTGLQNLINDFRNDMGTEQTTEITR